MKNPYQSFLLFFMLVVSGCNKCADTDCLSDEPFIFKLVDQQGNNLLDSEAFSLDQVAIYSPANQVDTLRLSAFHQENETWIETYIDRNTSEYILHIAGNEPVDLTFDLMSRETECCGTISFINEVYLNGDTIPTVKGWRAITIP